jgi:Glycosyl transferase family 2
MLYLFSSVYDDITILPQFIEHYLQLGIDRVVLNINTRQDPLMLDKVRFFTRDYPVSVSTVFCEPHTWPLQNLLRNRAQDQYMSDNDWAIIADIDEFQEYPSSLAALLRSCEERGENSIYGSFLDRISSTGELSLLRSDLPVGLQFPIGIPLTRKVLRAPADKVVAVRGSLKPPATCTPMTILRDEFGGRISAVRATIHHFKWHASVLKKLRERMDLYKQEFHAGNQQLRNYKESERFLLYYEIRGRIDVRDFLPEDVLRFDTSA